MSAVETNPDSFLKNLDHAFQASNLDFARAYYLFATAKLTETINSQEIYAKYPQLHDEHTLKQLKAQFNADPTQEIVTRYFSSVLDTVIGNQLASRSDAIENKKNQLTINVSDLGLSHDEGQPIEDLPYEDVPEWLKKLPEKDQRDALYQKMTQTFNEELAQEVQALMQQEDQLLTDQGFPDKIEFYSQMTGHPLPVLGERGKTVVEETDALYQERVSAFYTERTGLSFDSRATRADIAYVFHGPDPAVATIDKFFTKSNLVPLASKTFDGLGFEFSTIAQPVDYTSMAQYEEEVVQTTQSDPHQKRILLDVAHRSGKRSRAYVYPAQVPVEIYLSVKPEGGLDDYSAFFHESGHALHFAYTNPDLSFALSQMGNNTVTETYAYLFQNLFLNRHWLTHMAGLSSEQARTVVQRGALNDLYMLRRYGSKIQFELQLFNGTGFFGKGDVYRSLLTRGTGFQYDAQGWLRDVDAGFYVADYFTAWTLEAQLRQYLCNQFGSPEHQGEDWYQNPQAGSFLKKLWWEGNLNQKDLVAHLGSTDPNNTDALVQLMNQNLG